MTPNHEGGSLAAETAKLLAEVLAFMAGIFGLFKIFSSAAVKKATAMKDNKQEPHSTWDMLAMIHTEMKEHKIEVAAQHEALRAVMREHDNRARETFLETTKNIAGLSAQVNALGDRFDRLGAKVEILHAASDKHGQDIAVLKSHHEQQFRHP